MISHHSRGTAPPSTNSRTFSLHGSRFVEELNRRRHAASTRCVNKCAVSWSHRTVPSEHNHSKQKENHEDSAKTFVFSDHIMEYQLVLFIVFVIFKQAIARTLGASAALQRSSAVEIRDLWHIQELKKKLTCTKKIIQ